jgi:hypothetical protein
MNRRKTILCVASLLIMAAGAGFIVRLKAGQKLGQAGVVWGTVQRVAETNASDVSPVEVLLPGAVLNFECLPAEITAEERNTLPKDTTFGRRHYRAPDGFEAQLSVVLMGTDRTSLHKPQFCLTGQGWNIEKTERETIAMDRPHGYDLPVLKLTSRKLVQVEGRKVEAMGIYVYWFVADRQVTVSDRERMWSMARELMRTGTLQRWAYVSYFAVCAPGQEEETYRRLKELIALTVPEFQLAAGEAATGKGPGASLR